jgi:hypothetical protein
MKFAFIFAGIKMIEEGKYSVALENLEKAIKLKPNFGNGH